MRIVCLAGPQRRRREGVIATGRWGRRAQARPERGSAAVEMVLVMPVVLVLFLILVQLAVTGFAHRAAESAAEEALAAASAYRGSAGTGHVAGREALAHLDGGLHNVSISVRRSATNATATVTGTAPRLAPGFPVGVSVTVRGPVERFVEGTDP